MAAGNDLARCLHWGGSFHAPQRSITGLLHEIEHDAIVALLDRWNVTLDSTQQSSTQGTLSRMGSLRESDNPKVSHPALLKSPRRRLCIGPDHCSEASMLFSFIEDIHDRKGKFAEAWGSACICNVGCEEGNEQLPWHWCGCQSGAWFPCPQEFLPQLVLQPGWQQAVVHRLWSQRHFGPCLPRPRKKTRGCQQNCQSVVRKCGICLFGVLSFSKCQSDLIKRWRHSRRIGTKTCEPGGRGMIDHSRNGKKRDWGFASAGMNSNFNESYSRTLLLLWYRTQLEDGPAARADGMAVHESCCWSPPVCSAGGVRWQGAGLARRHWRHFASQHQQLHGRGRPLGFRRLAARSTSDYQAEHLWWPPWGLALPLLKPTSSPDLDFQVIEMLHFIAHSLGSGGHSRIGKLLLPAEEMKHLRIVFPDRWLLQKIGLATKPSMSSGVKAELSFKSLWSAGRGCVWQLASGPAAGGLEPCLETGTVQSAAHHH